jgi:hypothetical protein|tara:strand:- start:121 stop:345 length:225 start_codon:yes stop_codon:yes gene_type:complete
MNQVVGRFLISVYYRMSKSKDNEEYLTYFSKKEDKMSKLDYIIFKLERIESILMKKEKKQKALTREQISFEGED